MSPLNIGLALLVLISAICGLLHKKLIRVYQVITLFYPNRIVNNFRKMDAIFAAAPIHRPAVSHTFARQPTDLPKTYIYQGQNKDIATWFDESWTTGLVAIKDEAIIFEEYYRGNSETSKTISWSMSKSIVSALLGIAVAEGHIHSIQNPVTQYVHILKNTGYDEVAIKDVLQMSSGVRFDENYAAFFSDINRMGRTLAFDGAIDNFVCSLEREQTPGTYNHYVSMDTQVLAMVLRQATGESIQAYSESRLWQKIGMESDAYWLVDSQGIELAFGGLNAILRDYARFGLLYLQQGQWLDTQVVPAEWIKASVTPDAPHLQPGENVLSDSTFGYGYQWWIPPERADDFLAIGIYNQFIYVNPRHRVVIAQSAAYPDYERDGAEKSHEAIAVFRTIAAQAEWT